MRPPPEGVRPRPRPIIVKLVSYKYRQALLRNRKKLKRKKLKDEETRISIYEDLTDTNRLLLWEAQNEARKKESKISNAWSIDGRIIVSVKTVGKDGKDGKELKRQINSKRDLDRYANA